MLTTLLRSLMLERPHSSFLITHSPFLFAATLGLYYRTIRHLKLRQLVFQIWHRLRGRPRLRWATASPKCAAATHVPTPTYPATFTLLNRTVTFDNAVDWNYAAYGKLWTYNLTYFEWLAQQSAQQGYALIHDFIRQTPVLKDGLEPYPTSLRLINWRRFLQTHQLQDAAVERHLYAQTALLRSRLEYHLGANHLLENACALIIMAIHFQQGAWFKKASHLLRTELDEQILSDGGHYERSPVYHQLLVDRLLDVYETLHTAPWRPDPTLSTLIAAKLGLMLGWLQAVTFRNGDVPMVNDSAQGVAPSTASLLAKATALALTPTLVRLGDSGYRMLTTARLECFIDVGPVGPNHQPGHAHADTFSFILYADNKPVIVDIGTSTYEPGQRRTYERSTAAHNTVTIDGRNSSEVWGGFRVGRRARVRVLQDKEGLVSAQHDGYKKGVNSYHTRVWHITESNSLEIRDTISEKESIHQCRNFFNSSIHLTSEHNCIYADHVTIRCASPGSVSLSTNTRFMAAGFNKLQAASVLSVRFIQTITTTYTVSS